MQEELKGYSAELFKYNLIDINKYTKEKLLKEIEEKEDISMVAEIFAKECDKHFERGLNKGIKEGRKEAIIKMLKMNIDRKIIKEIYELDDIEIEKIEKKIS